MNFFEFWSKGSHRAKLVSKLAISKSFQFSSKKAYSLNFKMQILCLTSFGYSSRETTFVKKFHIWTNIDPARNNHDHGRLDYNEGKLWLPKAKSRPSLELAEFEEDG